MSTRQDAQRKLQQALNHIAGAGVVLNEVVEVYQTDHPEVSEPLFMANQGLVRVHELVEETLKNI